MSSNPSSSGTRRKKSSSSGGSRLPSMGTVVATAALAVGTYHVAKWAWGVYEESNRKQQQQQEQQKASAVEMKVSSERERQDAAVDSHDSVDEEEETLVEIVEEVIEEVVVEDRHDLALEDDHEESVASHGVRFLLPGRSAPAGDAKPSSGAAAAASKSASTSTNGTSDRSGTKPINGSGKARSQVAVEEKPSHSASNPQAPPGATSSSAAPSGPTKLTSSHLKVRRQRMSRCRDETAMALSGFLSTVRRVVDERTDTLQELRELKKLRAERARRTTSRGGGGSGGGGSDGDRTSSQLSSLSDETTARREKELWERVKVRSVTKMLASAYAHNLLFLVLTVQVNLLGGRLFEEQIDRSADVSNDETASAAERRMSSYQNSHRFVLTHTYEHFFSRGLVQLVDAVERATAEALADWDVLDAASLRFTVDQFDDGLQRVRTLLGETAATAESGAASAEARGLLRFLIPPADRDGVTPPLTIHDELARSILDETWDLLESPVWEDALASCLGTTFRMMRDNHWGTVFEDPSTSYTLSETADVPPNHIDVPLATVLTKLKNTTNSIYETAQSSSPNATAASSVPHTNGPSAVVHSSSYGTALEQLPIVRELADVSFG